MLQAEKPRKNTLRVTKEQKQRNIPEILTNSKIVITENLEPAYQLENGMVVITDKLNKRVEDWYDTT